MRKNVGRDSLTAVATSIEGLDTNKKTTRNTKKHSDTGKATATYNKLLDETRDEHYHILKK